MRRIDQLAGPLLLRALALFRRRGNPPPGDLRAIGILCAVPLGDLLISLSGMIPALRAKFPHARIIAFNAGFSRGAFALLPRVDKQITISLGNPLGAAALLRQEKLDVLIDLSQWANITAILSVLSGARHTIGFDTPHCARGRGYDTGVPHLDTRHELANYAALVKPLGIAQISEPALRLPQAEVEQVRQRHADRYMVFHAWPSGINKHLKQWPAAHWRALAEKFIALGYAVVFTGAQGDRAATQALIDGLPASSKARAINAAGSLSLRETALLIQGSAGLVSVNTGIMHIGAALDVPMAALHGPTNPLRWGPLSRKARVLIPSGPDVAYLNLGWEYPPGAQETLPRLSVDEVFDSMLAMQRQSRQGD
ncbi:MAG TPA: glycosyltransferase family 9 protein [Bordetella sp.]